MIKLEDLQTIINNELSINTPIDDVDECMLVDGILLGELLNPNGNTFKYKKIANYIWFYYDSVGNLYFVRMNYFPSPTNKFDLKTSWFKNNDTSLPMYEPSLPPSAVSIDMDIRTNTVAKIYKDEIIPSFKSQNKSNTLTITPISLSRYLFSIRMVNKLTPSNWDIIEDKPKLITILKK